MEFLSEVTDGEHKAALYNYNLRQRTCFFQNPGKNFLPALNIVSIKY